MRYTLKPAASATPLYGLPANLASTWNPGIPGGIPNYTTIHSTIGASYRDGITDATAAINNAIQAAGDTSQVVYLPTGTYRTTGIINLNRSNVVLRGDGPTLTKIKLDSIDTGLSAIRMGVFWPSYNPAVNVVGSVPKGATSITVADASGIQVGDVLQIDQFDDTGYVLLAGHVWYKRGPAQGGDDVNGPYSPSGYRSVGQQIEVATKNGAVLGLSRPTHIAFNAAFSPQVFKTATARSGEPGTRYAGLEDLYVTGGNSDNIMMLNLAYGWIKNIESDGNVAPGPGIHGQHVRIMHAYCCEIRGSYFHHARIINPGGTAYGISLLGLSSENLIEDNICRSLNKPLVVQVSGGGNVIAYNYVDEAIITNLPTWQEAGIDGCHGTFPHYDLFEGNWSPNIGSLSTWGNAGWMTFFRNYASGRNTSGTQTGDIRAVGVGGWHREHTFVGNVLLQSGLVINGNQPVYECSASGSCMNAAAVYRIGYAANRVDYDSFDDGTALSLLYRHANYDYVTDSVIYKSGEIQNLPDSLYLSAAPACFSGYTWPWVQPSGSTKLYVLPAKARYEAL